MEYFRLLKPSWGVKELPNGEPNKKFKKWVSGPNTIEGVDFSPEYLAEKNKEGYSIFFFPNRPKENVYSEDTKFLNGRLVDDFKFVFVDMDLKDKVYKTKEEFVEVLKNFPIPPSIVVDSGHGVHAYWAIGDLTRDQYLDAQVRLIEKFKTDHSIWTVLRLMRYPGYINTKNFSAPIPCKRVALDWTQPSVKLEDLLSHLPEITDDQSRRINTHKNRLDGKMDHILAREVSMEEVPDKFLSLCESNEKVRQLYQDPVGDRDAADMSLAHHLYTNEYDFREIYHILRGTQKALSKGGDGDRYAYNTTRNVFLRRSSRIFDSVKSHIQKQGGIVLEPPILGPSFLDFGVLGDQWRRQELLGIISGSGVGKTSVALNIVLDTILNNENDDIYVFFSLEMTKNQIAKRWIQLVGEDSPLSERLFVVDFLKEDKTHWTIGLQEMYQTCLDIKQQTGSRIGMLIVDHFHIVSTHIDSEKTPNFSINSEQGAGQGRLKNMSLGAMAKQLKVMITLLDSFGVILSQTTKGKGIEDLPLDKDASYGNSEFAWFMDRIITIWQPLFRLQSEISLSMLAFQYCKLREKNDGDTISVYEGRVVTFGKKTGRIYESSQEEYDSFLEYLPRADERRKMDLNRTEKEYTRGVIVR